MKTTNIFSRILDGLILLVFILFFASAGFQDKSISGWYQQFFPNLNGSTITDITFLDSLTGFAVTNTNSSLQAYILKTTNGGDNWSIVHTYVPPSTTVIFTKIQFADSIIGFVSTNYYDFFKTTNNGQSWINYPNVPFGAEDLSVNNKDTLFVVSSLGLGGGVYRSINGGVNWTRIWTTGSSGNPDKIYMINKDTGFIQGNTAYNMKKTTNGGFNWSEIPGEKYKEVAFFDNNTGWKIWQGIQKTTNGGLNWLTQQIPITPEFYSNNDISIVNKDTLWIAGVYKPGGVLFKTTNGGLNWGYQFPNPTLPITEFYKIKFSDSKHGWAFTLYGTDPLLFHTKVGGNDSTIFTGINIISNEIFSDYQLFQNYPNPFNATSNIKYKISRHSGSSTVNVRIEVMDILGRNIQTLVNKKQTPGTYEVNFNAESLPSGIYFYSMIIDGKNEETKKMSLLK